MGKLKKSLLSSLVKKFAMAITGFVLASFLLVHMLGNLQMLEGSPHAINAYANFLQTLPWEFLWGFRITLLACFVIHFLTAFLLWMENNKARPQVYAVKKHLAASFAARTMIYTGALVILFVIIHILQYTVLNLEPEFKILEWKATSGAYEGKVLHDVYAMLIIGFSNTWTALGYIFAMVLIGFHLSHGVSSMFQSVGFRNEAWRYRLNFIAVVYCAIVAVGFSVNPALVLLGKYTNFQILPVKQVLAQYESQKKAGADQIFIDYEAIEKASCPLASAGKTSK